MVPAGLGLGRSLGLAGSLLVLAGTAPPMAAQDTTAARLEVSLAGATRDPIVRTRNLLDEASWLTLLRQGLWVRLQYRLEIWRSRDAWLDEVQRQLEWTIVVRHEPLLDEFLVTRLGPVANSAVTRRVATPGALADLLGAPYQFQVGPRQSGRYYYTVSLAVATLSDSDLDKFERILRGEIDPRSSEGGSLAERARRLILRLAGLPTVSLHASSPAFEVAGDR